MSILPNETYADLLNDLYSKFPELQSGKRLEVRFKDEDGDMLNMEDEGDFEAAIDVARRVFLLLRILFLLPSLMSFLYRS
jgi:neutrophil factor 2